MFAAFTTVKLLHEMLWYLAEVGERTYDSNHVDEARSLTNTITALTASGPEEVLSVDVESLHSTVRVLLMDSSEEIRSRYFAEGDHQDARLTPGADLAEIDLRGLPCAEPVFVARASSRRTFDAAISRASTCSEQTCVTHGSREQISRVLCF